MSYSNPGLGLDYKTAVERNDGYDIVPYANQKAAADKQTTTLLVFGALAIGAYLIFEPKKKTKSSGLNAPKKKRKKRKNKKS